MAHTSTQMHRVTTRPPSIDAATSNHSAVDSAAINIEMKKATDQNAAENKDDSLVFKGLETKDSQDEIPSNSRLSSQQHSQPWPAGKKTSSSSQNNSTKIQSSSNIFAGEDLKRNQQNSSTSLNSEKSRESFVTSLNEKNLAKSPNE